ncbi:MAG: four helix bundle suffix domain-containing protein [Candidatus Binatia bacterium]
MSNRESDRSGGSDGSKGRTGNRQRRLRPSGGYRDLRSFQAATVIYDATVAFCDRFVDRRSRTRDQMVQAARSGRQNIAEGSRAAATSSQTELRLVNVARASLDELLLDYEDFLRQRGKRQWKKDDPEARQVRSVGTRRDPTDQTDRPDPTDHWKSYSRWLEAADPAVVANAVLCLIHQTNYLLDQQIAALERDFIAEGGYTEQLAAARLEERGRQRVVRTDLTDPSDRADRSDRAKQPPCPNCGKTMVLRTARQGKQSGSRFWGCLGYPECRGTREVGSDGSVGSDRSVGSGRSGKP